MSREGTVSASTGRRPGPGLFLLLPLAAALTALLWTSCGRTSPPPSPPPAQTPSPEKPAPPGPEPGPVKTPDPGPVEAPAPPKPAPPEVPEAWKPTEEQLAAAPGQAFSQSDPYTWRFVPEPTREILRGKTQVYLLALDFFKGSETASSEARKTLVDLGIPTAKYLVELAGLLVPKAERPVPDPDSWDLESPEDRALEVVKDIQEEYLKARDMKRLMSFFAAATGKTIDLDSKLIDLKREFRSFRVHPIPALWRVGEDLGCDTRVIAPDSTVVSLYLPVLMDMKIHQEDARWLLESMARLGGFEAELSEEVGGPVTLRVRADSYREAFVCIAGKAGLSVEETGKGFRVSKVK